MAEKNITKKGFWPTRRRLAQLYCALLYNANLKGFGEGKIYTGPLKNLCVPGLNCYSCPGAVGACPLGALQNALAASGTRTGTYVLGILMLFGLMLGRSICGWLCPFGLIQELVYKIPVPKIRKNRVTRALSYVKYAVLALFVLALPLYFGLGKGRALPAFCRFICPAGTLEGAGGLLANPVNRDLFSMLGILFADKVLILVLVLVLCIFCCRAFCRFLCPLGALYSLFSGIALTGIRVDRGRCNGCGACRKVCPMDIREPGDRECIHCGECISACSVCAISMKAGRHTLPDPDRKEGSAGTFRSLACRILPLVLLLGLLFCVNLRKPRENPAVPADTGYEAGQILSDFETGLIGGGSFALHDSRGRVTFINLWATYCDPCVRELPCFCRLKEEHPEVCVLAVHSGLVTEDVEAFLAERDWDIDFALDTEDQKIFSLAGGSSLLPQTLVLDPEGRVVFNQTGSVTYEMLEDLLKKAGNE